MPRTWRVLACPVCNELAGPGEVGIDEQVKCDGLGASGGERHKLTLMERIVVVEDTSPPIEVSDA